MKSATLFAVGTCCGALAAFVYTALVPVQRDTLSAERSADRASVADAANARTGVAIPGRDVPDGALREALAVEPSVLRTSAVARVAEVWARRDPEAALAAALELPADARAAYVSAVASEWAFFDPPGFFAYAEAAESINDLIGGLEVLIATDPERVWAIAAGFNGPGTAEVNALYLHAVRGMAGRDPYGAIVRLEAVATGPQRDPILASIAEAYAAVDADAALGWALSIMPSSPDALGKIIETVASEDLLRAYEMMRRMENSAVNAKSFGSVMAEAALRGRQPAASLARSLTERSEPDADVMLSGLLSRWTLQDPESAVVWMAGNEVHLTTELTGAMVSGLAFEDPPLAAELARRVPPSAQDQWLAEVSFRYGQFAVEEAMDWLAEYEGRAVYRAILTRTLGGGLRSDTEFVARYIETSEIDFDRELIYGTAFALVEQNPATAVQWAMRLEDPERSAWAIEGAIDRWARMDSAASTRWVLSQPRSATRDRILDSMMLSSIDSPGVDPAALFAAYYSNAAAQRTLAELVFRSTSVPRRMLGESLSEAERLLGLFTDATLRKQAEEQIAAAR